MLGGDIHHIQTLGEPSPSLGVHCSTLTYTTHSLRTIGLRTLVGIISELHSLLRVPSADLLLLSLVGAYELCGADTQGCLGVHILALLSTSPAGNLAILRLASSFIL